MFISFNLRTQKKFKVILIHLTISRFEVQSNTAVPGISKFVNVKTGFRNACLLTQYFNNTDIQDSLGLFCELGTLLDAL